MDMPGMTTDPAVANLDISDPKCVQAAEMCTAFYAAENASQAAVSWAGQFEYGHWATYYWVIIVGVLFLFQVFNVVKDRGYLSPPKSAQRLGVWKKIQAVGRMVFYIRLPPNRISNMLDMSSNFGVLAFLFITIVFLMGLTFAQRPYYREHLGYGSPPIAIRCGLMAFACVPILMALAGKANIITLFTGISHERLNVLHRWVAWMSFALSLVHAIPYFIASYQDYGNGGYQRVVKEFYSYGWHFADEATGVPPLAILFGLCVLSLPLIRQRFYESFYAAHIVLAITYFGLLFWHASNTLDSWSYLWATLAVWLTSWLTRLFYKTQPLKVTNTWFSGSPATLTTLHGDVTRMDVWPGNGFKWKPGQHCFLRFTNFAPLDNHPFTIASAAPVSGDEQSHLLFLARSHKGFTSKLSSYVHAHAEGKASVGTAVWLDGPYGGISRPLNTRYDSVILVAGGTGISACVPFALDLVARAKALRSISDPGMRLKRCVLVWAVRSEDALDWISEELKILSSVVTEKSVLQAENETEKHLEVVIRIHITGEGTENDIASRSSSGDAKLPSHKIYEMEPAQVISTTPTTVLDKARGRPNMPTLLNEFVRLEERTMVLGCGPEGFRTDLANAVAGSQSRVLKGECTEIGMHLESFGW